MTKDGKEKNKWKTLTGDAVSVVANLNFVTGLAYAVGATIVEYLRLVGKDRRKEDREDKEPQAGSEPGATSKPSSE